MHLRRALLLFAIVLGLAALASTISRPESTDDEAPPATTEATAPPTVAPGAGAGEPAEVSFDAAEPRVRKLEAGRAATLRVAVDAPGSVEIPQLGLSAAAEPLTPAHFDVLLSQPGRYQLRFVPAAGDEGRPAGTLVVRAGEA